MTTYLLHLKKTKTLLRVMAYGFTRKDGRIYFHKDPDKKDLDFFYDEALIDAFDREEPLPMPGSPVRR